MQITGRKPPLLLRWLDVESRITLAERIRNIGADLAEWVAPEIAPEGKQIPAVGWRLTGYAFVGAVVALFLVICALDANAGLTINRLNAPMRATAY